MKSSAASDHQYSQRNFNSALGRGLLICTVIVACVSSASAQLSAPTATPASTVAPGPEATPVATPTPVPVDPPPASPVPTPGGDLPVTTISPGVPDAAVEASYLAARTPQASIILSSPSSGVTNSTLGRSLTAGREQAAADPNSTVRPVPSRGAFTQVLLTTSQVASSAKSTQTSVSTTNNAAAAQVPLAVVTLNYGAAWAGQLVFVRPLTGGTVSATDGGGTVSTATTDGILLTLDTAGTATFGFQSPNAAKTYQVYTRLDNVASTLTFVVPDNNL